MPEYRNATVARTQWCPMIRVTSNTDQDGSYEVTNRMESNPGCHECCCLADDCAWWVKSQAHPDRGYCGHLHPET